MNVFCLEIIDNNLHLLIKNKSMPTHNEPSAEQCGRFPVGGIQQTYKR
jgi:hypothetical protein